MDDKNLIQIDYFNPNKKCDLPHISGDCIIRAICKITGLEWDEVYIRLCKRGFELGIIPNSVYVVEKEFDDILELIECDLPCKTLKEFILENKIGSFIAITKGHAFTIIDGTIYDATNKTFLSETGYSKKVYKYFSLKNWKG